MRTIFAALALAFLRIATAMAGHLEDAVAANQKGDYATAMSLLRPLADEGDAHAQFGVGGLYWNGHGVTADTQEALKWFRLAAAQNFAEAQLNVGLIYSGGEGVPKDEKEAAKWFQLAAVQGNGQAQFSLATMYATGSGLRKDPLRAQMWFTLGAKHGADDPQNWRDTWTKSLTANQIMQAQVMSEHCESSSYKEC